MEAVRVNSANATASGTISMEEINKQIDLLAAQQAKRAKIDGFRRGKVPVEVIKTRYKDSLQTESKQKSLEAFYAEAIKKLGLERTELIGEPLVAKFEESEAGLNLELKIGITPEFSVEGVMGCLPSFELESISEAQVEERLEKLAKDRAPLVDSTDTVLKDGHIANIDFEGFLEGKSFEGGKAEGFNLLIGSKQFVPGFEEALVGLSVGDEKTIEVVFPADYKAPNLAGQKVDFKVKLHAIKQKAEVSIDEKLAKEILGDKEDSSLAALREQLKKELETESRMKLYNDGLKEKALENIANTFSFDLPENILEQEMTVLFNNEVANLKQEELEELKKDKEKAKALREAQRPKAETSVKVTFVVDKLAKQENVSVEDKEVFQTIYYESMMNGHNPQEVLEHYQKNNLLPAIKMALVEDRVITHLLDKSKGLK